MDKIFKISDSNKRVAELKKHCDGLIKKKNIEKLKSFASTIIESQDHVASRPSLLHFANELVKKFKKQKEKFIEIAEYVLKILGKRSSSFMEASNILRQALSDIFEEDGDYTRAAKILAGVNLDGKSDQEKVNTLVHVAQLYLLDEESEFANTFINKASQYRIEKMDVNSHIKLKLCNAQINDYRRKFLESSRQYYVISHLTVESDVPEILRSSVIACILAPAGPQRSRQLGILFKDDRTHSIEVFTVMEKMYLGRIVRIQEEKKIEEHLLSHHKAITAEGFTVLKKAIIEHNLEAASKIYNNITIKELGNLLGVKPEKAEEIAAKMITEERLHGYLDQVDGILYFEDVGASLKSWDEQIEKICLGVEKLSSEITTKYAKLL